jgi:hypothetical protein
LFTQQAWLDPTPLNISSDNLLANNQHYEEEFNYNLLIASFTSLKFDAQEAFKVQLFSQLNPHE